MKIALYQGKSFISRCIRWQSRSVYSHAAFLLDDGSVIEAWQPYVRRVTGRRIALTNRYEPVSSLSEQHTAGTVVDIFEFCCPLTPMENQKLEYFVRQDLGINYDYVGIVRFVTRYGGGSDKRLFCSEQVFDRCAQIGRPLLERCEGWEIPPRDIARSPHLKLSQTVVTT